MASRMERYYSGTNEKAGRSRKNKKLYDEIQSIDSYNNIEAVATIEKTNEIDITKVQQMLKNRENYNKEKKYLDLISKDEKAVKKQQLFEEEERVYDIIDVLNKAKNERLEDVNNIENLSDNEYNLLKSLQLKDKDYTEGEELKELIDSITKNNKKDYTEFEESDLFSELKANTVVGDASSMKDIIEEEKGKLRVQDTNVDNSFYTSSLGFSSKDFEDLANINDNVKKNNILIKILFGIIALVIVAIIVVLIF